MNPTGHVPTPAEQRPGPARPPRRRPGPPPLADPIVAVAVRLRRSALDRLAALVAERRAAEPGLTRQDVLRAAVDRHLRVEERRVGSGDVSGRSTTVGA